MEKITFPVDKKVSLRPIIRKGGWLPPGHDGAFMLSNTHANLVVLEDSLGALRLNASPEELEALEKACQFKEGFLNPNLPDKENFWRKHKTRITISKEGLTLDLKNPQDYIKYIIAKSNFGFLVAPTWEKRLDKGTYKFALVDQEEELKTKAEEADITKDVWMAYGQISTSKVKMINVLKLLHMGTANKVGKNPNDDFLKTELKKFAENEPKKFITVVNDPDFTVKADILTAVENRAITKDGIKYYITGYPDAKMTFEAMTEYLKNPENQDIYLELKQKISE